MIFSKQHLTPVGRFSLEGDDRSLTRIGFGSPSAPAGAADSLSAAAEQLDQYLAGERTAFDLDLEQQYGTAFERRVWDAVAAIPYGQTATYAEIAERIGSPAACRAVGRANGRNPIAIVVPCHRVIGSDGSLTGYAGGLPMKRALLELERRVAGAAPASRTRAASPTAPASPTHGSARQLTSV
jgi:methylated-DNA-[protein]-cysteine S-methyltransferase